jgi:ssDNA-binding Zn-finger/Zn-ribbon topoisomerase 1
MGSIVKYECDNCNFKFTDESLIFYLNENEDEIIIDSLTLKTSKEMDKSILAGYLYIGYCKNCDSFIKTYVPEINNSKLSDDEIIDIIHNISKETDLKFDKVISFDFNKTSFQHRRKILTENKCPNCENEMALLIDDLHPCPNCGEEKLKAIETINIK